MTDAIARVKTAIALRDAIFASEGKTQYTNGDHNELMCALIDAAPEMLRAVEENARLKEQVRRLREALDPSTRFRAWCISLLEWRDRHE